VKDLNDVLLKAGKKKIISMIETAELIPLSGVIDMAQIQDFDINKAECISSGLNGLNRWIKGFPLGSVVVIFGINGSGKTVLVNQMCICEPLSQGYKVFIYSGEVPRPQLRNLIEFPMAGPDQILRFDNGPHAPIGYAVSYEAKRKMAEWYSGKVFVYCNDDDITADTILGKMEAVAKRYGVKVFVLDNLAVIDIGGNEMEKHSKQKEFVRKLVQFSKKYNAVTFLVTHPRKTDTVKRLTKLDISGSADISNLAHIVLSVHRTTPEEKMDELNKKGEVVKQGCPYDTLIDLHKNRLMGHQDKTIGLHFDEKSKRMYGDSDDLNKEYGWEPIWKEVPTPGDLPF